MNSSDVRDELVRLQRFVTWIAITWVPATTLLVLLGYASGSLALVASALDYGFSIIMNLAALAVIGLVLRQNVFKYPYGTGKIENLAGFFYGIIVILVGLAILYAAYGGYKHPRSPVDFSLVPAYLLLLVRRLVLVTWICSIKKRATPDSPLVQAYYFDQRINLFGELLVFTGLMTAMAVAGSGHAAAASVIDLLLAVALTVYMLACGVRMIALNLPPLLAMPLSEPDQLQILAALTAEFDSYSGVGAIFTQMSGSQRLIQIELEFPPEATVREIEELRGRIEQQLQATFSRMTFHLIPRRAGGR